MTPSPPSNTPAERPLGARGAPLRYSPRDFPGVDRWGPELGLEMIAANPDGSNNEPRMIRSEFWAQAVYDLVIALEDRGQAVVSRLRRLWGN